MADQPALKQPKDEKDEEPEEKYASHPKSAKRLSLEGALKAGRKSLEKYVNPKILIKDKLIPKKILKNAKGIVFLTCIKAGFLFAGNVGCGCVIIRQQTNNITGWSPPSAIAMGGVSFGFLAGASKVDYVFILNDDFAVKQFSGGGQLRLGGEIGVALGPVGRDADASLGLGDGGVSAIYSYSHTEGLYGGLELKGKIITVLPKYNARFYKVKGVKCAQILSGSVAMPVPVNEDYNRIVHLLNTYALDHVFPQQIEESVDAEAVKKAKDVNVSNAVNNLHCMFTDIDVGVIRVVLMEQCWGDVNQATDVLLNMSSGGYVNKRIIERKLEEHDSDLVTTDFEQSQLPQIQEIANKVKVDVTEQAEIQKVDKIECYAVLSGRCTSKAVESYQLEIKKTASNKETTCIEKVCDMKYRIKVKIGGGRICEILVYKSNPPLKYQLLTVEFGLEHIEEELEQSGLEGHEQNIEEEKQETSATLEPFSSNRLKHFAKSNTKKHAELSDDEIDWGLIETIWDEDDKEDENEEEEEKEKENDITMSLVDLLDGLDDDENEDENDNDNDNAKSHVDLLDGLVKSFEPKVDAKAVDKEDEKENVAVAEDKLKDKLKAVLNAKQYVDDAAAASSGSVVMIARSDCKFCAEVLIILQKYSENVITKEIDADFKESEVEQISNYCKTLTQTSVPIVFIDGKCVGGCDDAKALDERGELKTLIENATKAPIASKAQ